MATAKIGAPVRVQMDKRRAPPPRRTRDATRNQVVGSPLRRQHHSFCRRVAADILGTAQHTGLLQLWADFKSALRVTISLARPLGAFRTRQTMARAAERALL